jgi:pyridoxamine 5'-phosphate oxidase
MDSIADIRKEYAKLSLDVKDVNGDPMVQFQKWFDDALRAQVPEPNAMHLATVQDNKPHARIVLLKGVEHNQFVFFTNYQSNKGKELEANPVCAITFFWPELERQVRIEGIAERIDEQRSTAYFQSRPRASQIGAWSSPQSLTIDNREILEQRVKRIEERFKNETVLPKPHQWGGFAVTPIQIEFWQGRPSRLHDRILYSSNEKGAWKITRLAP